MHLERVDTKINMADMFTKSLPKIMFYRHADYLLGHIPPKYSPVYSYLVGAFSDANLDTAMCVPTSYTTPITAAATRVCAPLSTDYSGNPWTIVLWHGQYNSSLHFGLWGGVIVDTQIRQVVTQSYFSHRFHATGLGQWDVVKNNTERVVYLFLHGLHYQRIFTVDGCYSDIVDGGDGDGEDDEEDEDYEDEDDASNRVTVRIVWDNDYNECILAQTTPPEVVEKLSLCVPEPILAGCNDNPKSG